MGTLKYTSKIENAMPEWLSCMHARVLNAYPDEVEEDEPFFEQLNDFIMDLLVRWMDDRGNSLVIHSNITTEIADADGKTRLHIRRNGKIVMAYYVENS